MKKLAIAAAVAAATISAGAHAARPVHVDFGSPSIEMFIAYSALVVTCPVDSKVFAIDGFNTGLVQMQGNVCLDPYGVGEPFIMLNFNRVTGAYSGAGANPGTTFTSGSIAIDVQTTGGYIGYDVINVSVNNLACLSTTAGGLGGVPTAGLQFPGGSNPLPGIWDGIAASPLEGDALCVTTLLGQNVALFGKGKTVN